MVDKPPENPAIKAIITSCQIPAIPRVLQAILDATNNPATTSAQLEELVNKDPSICMQMLKLVNSTFYGMPMKVKTISQSILLLGYSTVKSIASGMVMLETFGKLGKSDQSYLLKVWSHGLLTASLINIVAARETKKKQEEIFLAALVHDVGHLVLNRYKPGDYRKLFVLSGFFPSVTHEKTALGVDHVEVGVELLRSWAFPESTIDMIKYHHPEKVPEADRSKVELAVCYLQICDWLGHNLPAGDPFFETTDDTKIPPEIKEVMTRINMKWADVVKDKEKLLKLARNAEGLAALG